MQLVDQAFQEKKLNNTARDEVARWLTEDEFAEFRSQLISEIHQGNWDSLMDKFYRIVIFGTGGIRGVMDIGTNRINNYTVRWASQAYAQYLNKHKASLVQNGIGIAYDSRHQSDTFMKETARVLAANGIPVHVFDYYRATPELSFTVRHLNLAGGIVITASHNPPEFNGYKVYDENGVQVLPDTGLQIEEEFKTVTTIIKLDYEDAVTKGLIKIINKDVDEAFARSAEKVSVIESREAKIVFSPLHGVGSQSVLPVLKTIGFKDIVEVEDQMSLDGDFPNVEGHFPNPEFPVVYTEAIEKAKLVGADIVIVSDPDADRLGIAVPDQYKNWASLNGNQGAVLMGYFYLNALSEAKKLPKNPVVIKTSVTTELVRDVAESFGAEVIGDLLVGFKFIGDRLEHMDKSKSFMFGCEESVGYLFSRDYRDKGAETPAVIAAEMAVWCRANQLTPMGLLDKIYEKYGYYAERLYYREIEGFGAFDRMNLAMAKLREALPKEIAGKSITKILDRLSGELRDGQTGELLETRDWDKGDMLSFFLSDDERNAVHVRPSGTEPKMKYYTAIKGMLSENTKQSLDADAVSVEKSISQYFEGILENIRVDVFNQ